MLLLGTRVPPSWCLICHVPNEICCVWHIPSPNSSIYLPNLPWILTGVGKLSLLSWMKMARKYPNIAIQTWWTWWRTIGFWCIFWCFRVWRQLGTPDMAIDLAWPRLAQRTKTKLSDSHSKLILQLCSYMTLSVRVCVCLMIWYISKMMHVW